MTKPSDEKKTSRRDFLKIAGTAPAAVAVAAVGSEAAALEAETTNGSGLQDTLHIQTYYETARF